MYTIHTYIYALDPYQCVHLVLSSLRKVPPLATVSPGPKQVAVVALPVHYYVHTLTDLIVNQQPISQLQHNIGATWSIVTNIIQ